MGPFLGTDAFRRDAVAEGDAAAMPLAGQAYFDGVVAFANWPRRDVQAVLPEGMELAENGVAPGLHPVVFLLGEQTEGALIFGGFMIPTGIRYHEIAVGVPFVRHGRDPRLHLYVARMYSSYFPAVWNGNVHYGFAKEVAHLRQEPGAVVAVGEAGTPLLRAEVEPAGDWQPGAACGLANFAGMRAVFALPVVGRRADGSFVCSRFEWTFADARVRRARGQMAIEAPLGRGLGPRRCPLVSDGAFELQRMLWRLSWPTPCRF